MCRKRTVVRAPKKKKKKKFKITVDFFTKVLYNIIVKKKTKELIIMFNNNLTPELFNLLTLPFSDDVDDYTKEDILRLITAAYESIQGK